MPSISYEQMKGIMMTAPSIAAPKKIILATDLGPRTDRRKKI
jgi:hypothetical protein